MTTAIVDPTTLSFSDIKTEIENYVKSIEGYDTWRDFFESSTGQIIIELIAGFDAYIAWHTIVARREAYLQTVGKSTSGTAISETLGHSVSKGKNLKLNLTVAPDQTVALQRYAVVGSYTGYDLVTTRDCSITLKTPIAQVTKITCVPVGTTTIKAGSYFLIYSPTVDYYVWFTVGGVGTDPAVANSIGIKVELVSGATIGTVASTLASTLDDHSAFSAVVTEGIYVTTTNLALGAVTSPKDINTGVSFEITTTGISNEETIEVLLGTLTEESKTYESSGITVLRFNSTTVSEDYRLLLNNSEVPVSDLLLDLSSDKYVAITNHLNGVDVFYLNENIKEVTKISCNPGASLSGGEYLTLSSPDTDYYLWYAVDTVGVDPFISDATGIKTSILSTDTEIEVASKTALAVDAIDDLTSTSYREIVTITNNVGGVVDHALDYSTNFIINIFTEGTAGTYAYGPNSVLKLEFLASNTIDIFDTGDSDFFYGSVVSSQITRKYEPQQTLTQTKVRAPFYHETQKIIRGRNDYLKSFLLLDTNLADTNGRDISPAVINLTYVKIDLTFYSTSEKTNIISELGLYRDFGVEPVGDLENPIQIDIPFTITITISSGVTVAGLTVTNDVTAILETYNKQFSIDIVLADIEEAIESLSYVKVARVYITTTEWDYNKAFKEGSYVPHPTNNDYVFQGQLAYTSGLTEPTWPDVIGYTVNDNKIKWICEYQADTFSLPQHELEFFTLNADSANDDIANKYIDLTFTPQENEDVLLFVVGGTVQEYNVDFKMDLINNKRLTWDALALEPFLALGDTLAVYYSIQRDSPSEYDQKTYTLTAVDITNKYVLLDYIPFDRPQVLVNVVGGGTQIFDTDYTISVYYPKKLTWDNYALTHTLGIGDRITVYYKIAKDISQWKASNWYEIGDVVYPGNVLSDKQYRVVDYLRYSGLTIPTWPTVINQEVVDNEILWKTVTSDPLVTVTWATSTIYQIGDSINTGSLTATCIGFLGYSSPTIKPVWPAIIGEYVYDKNVKWICRSKEDNVLGDTGLKWNEFFITSSTITL